MLLSLCRILRKPVYLPRIVSSTSWLFGHQSSVLVPPYGLSCNHKVGFQVVPDNRFPISCPPLPNCLPIVMIVLFVIIVTPICSYYCISHFKYTLIIYSYYNVILLFFLSIFTLFLFQISSALLFLTYFILNSAFHHCTISKIFF